MPRPALHLIKTGLTYRLEFRRYQLALRAPLRTAHGTWREREGVLIRLENEHGMVGYGEAATLPWFGTETADEVAAHCRELGGLLDASSLAHVPEEIACLRNALRAAQNEIEETRAGATAGIARPHLGVAALVPAGHAALAEIRAKAEAGFRVFKWKVGVGEIGDELALLDDVCAELPDGAKLRIDANGAWDRRGAERWLERCAERPVEFVEQPCFAARSAGESARQRAEDLLRGLAGDFPTPIALDESLLGERDIDRWLGAGWPGVFVVKPSLLGNPQQALANLERAKAAVVFSSALETVLGARAALRLAFAWKGERRALGFGVWPLFADTRFDGPTAAPFLRWEDVERINAEAVWTALS